jgi:hypothetical protein
MIGIEYILETEWKQAAYILATGDTNLAHVSERVWRLWRDSTRARKLPREQRISVQAQILADFQRDGWT